LGAAALAVLGREHLYSAAVKGFQRRTDRWFLAQVGVRLKTIAEEEGIRSSALSGSLLAFRDDVKVGLGLTGVTDPSGSDDRDRALPTAREWQIVQKYVEGLDRASVMHELGDISSSRISQVLRKAQRYLEAQPDHDPALLESLIARRNIERK